MAQRPANIFMAYLFQLLLIVMLLPSAAFGEQVLKIGGVGCVLGSMKILAAAFEKSHPGVKVKVLPSLGTSGSLKAVHQGAIDIGIGGRPMKAEEQGLGLHTIEYARTPLVFVTKKEIAKNDLTTQEFLKILRGELQTWPDGRRIRMVLRPATDSEHIVLKTASPEIGKALENALAQKGMQVALTSQDCANAVEGVSGALGYSTLTLVLSEKRPLKILSYNGVTPDLKTIADKSYPFSELLYLVTKDAPAGLIKQFIDFLLASEGRKILRQTGNLPIS